MSTLSAPSVPFHQSTRPPGYERRECEGCGSGLIVPAGAVDPRCRACHRAEVVAEATRLLADVKALATGAAPFDVLTLEEREEQLSQLLHVEGDRPAKYPGFRKMSDDALINLVGDPWPIAPGDDVEAMVSEAAAELARRLAAPTPEEREDIEARVVVMDADFLEADRFDGME